MPFYLKRGLFTFIGLVFYSTFHQGKNSFFPVASNWDMGWILYVNIKESLIPLHSLVFRVEHYHLNGNVMSVFEHYLLSWLFNEKWGYEMWPFLPLATERLMYTSHVWILFLMEFCFFLVLCVRNISIIELLI